jgi:hypothetical protein
MSAFEIDALRRHPDRGHVALHEGGDPEWDLALLVCYPSRAAFIDMVTRADYLEANVDRQNGVDKHLILAATTMIASPFPQSPPPSTR